VEVRLPSIPVEQDNPFLRAEMRGDDEIVRSITRMDEVKEPVVTMRVQPGLPGRDRMTRSLHIQSSMLSSMWSSGQTGEDRIRVNRRPHSSLGMSHMYTPYTGRHQRQYGQGSILGERVQYFKERKRRRSEEGIEFNNRYNQAKLRARVKKNPLAERVKRAPSNITETQKLLKLDFFPVRYSTQAPNLRLDILKVQHFRQHQSQSESCSSPPSSAEKSSFKLSKNNLKQFQCEGPDKNYMLAKFLRENINQEDKWTHWEKQLQMSIEYWHKRFPSCSQLQAVA